MVALSIVGSATLLFSCGKDAKRITVDYETLMTESSENRTITMMENGKRSYVFTAPILEGYSLAKNPYQEFRRGIRLTTFTDSLSLEDATITANYAIYYEHQKLWEAKGNVVIVKRNRKAGDTTVTGHTEVYTQQLFWNATTKKIYSNVDTKVLQPDGWHFGVGFDADDDLKNIHFRKYSSEMEFDMSQPEPKSEEEKKREEEEKKKKEEEKKKGNAKPNRQQPGRQPQNKNAARPNNRPASISPSTPSTPRPSNPDADKLNRPIVPAQGKKNLDNASLQVTTDPAMPKATSGKLNMGDKTLPASQVAPTNLKAREATTKK